jgi:hypothetical protein
MDLALSMEQFRFVLSQQSVWAEMYRKQQKEKRKDKNEEMYSKNYYGNSKEYRRAWAKNGAHVNK